MFERHLKKRFDRIDCSSVFEKWYFSRRFKRKSHQDFAKHQLETANIKREFNEYIERRRIAKNNLKLVIEKRKTKKKISVKALNITVKHIRG
jgi:hypothetical protein